MTILHSRGPVSPDTPDLARAALEADVFSGAPPELNRRVVRIYEPAKNAMQSGTNQTHYWRLDWEIDSKSNRWENDLIGWQSSGDYMQGTHLKFSSAEDAVHFCEKQGRGESGRD